MKKKLLILAVICLISTPVFAKTKEVYDSNQEPIIINQYDVELTAWIEKLSVCESGNRWEAIHKNDGGSDSLGVLQFKVTTFNHYVKRYDLPYVSEDIWNGDKQKEVAKLMLKEDIKNQNHWFNCSNKIGRLK